MADHARPVNLRLPVLGTASAHVMVHVAAEHGIPRQRCLQGTGISSGQLDDPMATIRLSQEYTLARNLVGELGHLPGLAFQIGQRYRLTMYGAYGWAILCSPTPRDSLAFAKKYFDLSYSLSQITVTAAGGLTRITISERWLPEDIGPFFVQRSLGAVVRLLSDIIPGNGWLKEVSSAEPGGDEASPLRAAIDAPLLSGRPRTEIVVYDRALDRPMPMADAQAFTLAERLCREQLDRRRAQLAVTESVRQYLAQFLSEAPAPATVASALGMSARTLRRRLAEEGASFQRLHDEVRSRLAGDLLLAGIQPAQVARRVGFADHAAFTHAFRRWYGVAPREFS
ncbi:MAG TPA: AraC family transcriptional regulator ligand-binding domain-containing protein [Streptosporangiaceae bacterium]|nr:AraC family transcriptional regulator ligand-binding domain-containing protein [Streptosporangiaceae bacterium]